MNNHNADAERMRAILIEGRNNKGWSQLELSRRLGKYKNFVWKYERSERAIKAAEFVRIARVLGIDPSIAVRDLGTASYDSTQTEPLRRAYAGTPLAQKLGILPNMRLFAIRAPAHYQRLLEPLPDGVRFASRLTKATQLVHIFATHRKSLNDILKSHAGKLRDDAVVWVSWPKRSSQEYTDLTADAVNDAASTMGLVEVDMCTVDSTWSALKFEKKRRG